METGNLWGDLIFLAATAVPGGLLVISVLMTTFAVVGQVLLEVRRSRALRFEGASGGAHADNPTTTGATVTD